MSGERRLGAIVRGAGTEFRIWAPKATALELVVVQRADETVWPERTVAMTPEAHGYWSATVEACGAGDRYAYLVDGEGPFPDPASRSQPDGVHLASEIVDTSAFPWTDDGWRPPAADEAVIYELHVGTFTPEGTFAAAAARLPYLAELGVTVIELMPLAAFPGRWGWGYDGVSQFAPFAGYGAPEDLCRFVDAAHALGLAIILDVVFNHFGPDGDYTGVYAGAYRNPQQPTPWGDAINFDGEGAAEVRAFYREVVLLWLHDYHMDGFRFDAAHEIIDHSPRHILAELAEVARRQGRPGIVPLLIAETNQNDPRYAEPEAAGGYDFDGVWADDFHHCARTAIVDEHEGYFRSYEGTLAELAACISQGFLFEGQDDPHTGQPRGRPARELPWHAFVYCLENHDQVGNRAFGERLSIDAAHAQVRALTALLLLLPQTPMLFQGQEFFTSSPFLYFTDHREPLGSMVVEGRKRELGAFAMFRESEVRDLMPSPQDPRSFRRCQLNWDEAHLGPGVLALNLHRTLLLLRRSLPVLVRSRAGREPITTRIEGEVLSVRIANAAGTALLVLNLGAPTTLATDLGQRARVVFSSEETRFGGYGRAATLADGVLTLPPSSAVLCLDGDGDGDGTPEA